jgi:FKBP-type peptidyl-prolyl cis-trans isomerase FklB
MKKLLFVVCLFAGVQSVMSQVKKPATPVAKSAAPKPAQPMKALKTMSDSVSYSLGVKIAQSLKTQGFDDLNFAMVQKAFTDIKNGAKPIMTDEAINNCLGQYQAKKNAEKSLSSKKEGLAFLAANGKRPGVVTTASGLQYQVLRAGTDATKPTLDSKVRCHYHGTLINGEIFDSSVDRGEPITFPLNGVIRGWQEGLQLMTVGSKWKFFIPSDLAYGDGGTGGQIGPGATLIFEVELLGVEK